MPRNHRLIEERFETEHVKGEWEPSSVRVPHHVQTHQDFINFVKKLNQSAKQNGEFVKYRSVENEDVF